MEYVYAAMLLHKAGKEITEDSVKKVLQGAGVTPDEARVKALVTALQGVNIEEAIKKAATAAPAAAPAAEAAPAGEEKKKDEKKDKEADKKTEEAAAAGLGALFGMVF